LLTAPGFASGLAVVGRDDELAVGCISSPTALARSLAAAFALASFSWAELGLGRLGRDLGVEARGQLRLALLHRQVRRGR
jgi:hypothetical protein